MNQQTLLRFIRQIILTSHGGAQSILALGELESILEKQGVPEESLALIRDAVRGLEDSQTTMQSTLDQFSSLSPEDLRTAVMRAHEQKLRDDEARRNGRC